MNECVNETDVNWEMSSIQFFFLCLFCEEANKENNASSCESFFGNEAKKWCVLIVREEKEERNVKICIALHYINRLI